MAATQTKPICRNYNWKVGMSEANNKYPLIIESKSNYAYVLKRKKQLSFNAIRNASNVFYNQLPIEIRNELHQQILRGTCQLDNETELNAYMHDMSLMHNAKLRDAFSHLSTNFFNEREIDIIDYGCGKQWDVLVMLTI